MAKHRRDRIAGVILEHEHYHGSKERGAWKPGLLLKSTEEYHASFMSIHGWPRDVLNENRKIIDKINLRTGCQEPVGEFRRRPESEQFFRLTKTAKQAMSVLSSIQSDAVRRKKGRSKLDRIFRQAPRAR